MNLLTIEHLTKSYTERLLFNDTAFSINEGEKVGLIGINGTGTVSYTHLPDTICAATRDESTFSTS